MIDNIICSFGRAIQGLIYFLTGGRPMMKLNRIGFMDVVNGRMVNYYIDKWGRKWMAQSEWSFFRVRLTNEQDN